MPAFVVYLVWRWLYDPLSGLINYALIDLGLVASPDRVPLRSQHGHGLGDRRPRPGATFPSSRSRSSPGCRPSRRSSTTPPQVDGASRLQQFRHITLPGLYHIIGVVLLLSTIWTANAFEPVYLLTGGGPSDATMVYTMLVYVMGMVNLRLGEAAAVSTLVPAAARRPGAGRHHPPAAGKPTREEAELMREPLSIRVLTYGLLALFVSDGRGAALLDGDDRAQDEQGPLRGLQLPAAPAHARALRPRHPARGPPDQHPEQLRGGVDDDRGHGGRERARRLQHRALPLPGAGVDRPLHPVQVPAARPRCSSSRSTRSWSRSASATR